MVKERKPTIFENRVYEVVSQIPRGKVSTYIDIARVLAIASPRAVGQALRRNPYAPQVPCHRVVCADGRIGGFYGESAGPLIEEKMRMLSEEGVIIQACRVDLRQCRHAWHGAPHSPSKA
jgi:methylated-DNA-[protein]-cysteine S-methyltransferase